MKDDPLNPEILKIDDAARLLGVTRRWLYRRIWSGDLPASKVGGFYFLRRQDLDTLISQGRSAGSVLDTGELKTVLLKCGYCFRLLESESLIGEVCVTEDCAELICSQCWAEGNHYCTRHVPNRETLWLEAVERHRQGETPVLLKADLARLREVNFIQRLQSNMTQVGTLRHPLSEDVLVIENWDRYLEESDERSAIMKLMNRVVLPADWTTQIPLNLSLRYQIEPPNKQKTFPVAIVARVVSHSENMLQMGFDTRPFGVSELTGILLELGEQAQKNQVFTIVMLASLTGWDAEARKVILGEALGTAFSHRWMLVYLNDLEKRELVFNRLDSRTRGYAELFTALSNEEDLDEIIKAIEKEMGIYDSFTLSEAIQSLPYPQKSIEKAFARLASGGRFALTEVPELGQAIVRI